MQVEGGIYCKNAREFISTGHYIEREIGEGERGEYNVF